ncbi:MAG: co-chaperone Hsc20 [Bacteroidota bacterium]|jgi:DnaJ-domain-containing protein 1
MENPFAFFGIEPSLIIDEKALRRKYLDIQRGSHPDLQSHVVEPSGDDSEKANEFYKSLMNRELRVKSYLMLKSNSDIKDNQLPTSYLMDMMELSDEIESMDRSDEAQTKNVEAMLLGKETALEAEFAAIATNTVPDIESLVLWYQKQKYLLRLRKNFEGIEEF